MKLKISIILLLLLSLTCFSKNRKPQIETFQKIEISWDQMLLEDMRRESSTLKMVDCKHNIATSTEEQVKQIESAIRRKVDAIIVHPSDPEILTPVIEKTYDAGIFVVLVGHKLPTQKYSVFSGINSTLLGRNAAKYICEKLNYKGNIVVLGTYSDDPFYTNSFDSFTRVIDNYPNIRIAGRMDSFKDDLSSRARLDSLKNTLKGARIDLVYSFGSMATSVSESGAFPEALFVGNYTVSGESLQAVINGNLDAIIFNPTGGKEAVEAAVNLVKGVQLEKDRYIQPMLVDSANAEIIQNGVTALTNYKNKVDFLRDEFVNQNKQLSSLHSILMILLLLVVVFAFVIIIDAIKGFKSRRLARELEYRANKFEEQFNEMALQKEVAERMRWQLEAERDALLEANMPAAETAPRDVVAEAAFLNEFKKIVEKHIDNSDLSVDDLADKLNVSRAQLFRKIKNESGSTPNELLLSIRLEKAKQLLQDGDMNVSEIAYAVGYASPSYFSKSFKDKYGIAPSEMIEKRGRV